MAKPAQHAPPLPYDQQGYWHRARAPLQVLLFMAPMLLLYELGTIVYATDTANGVTRYIYARSLLRDFFEVIGVTGYYLPGLIVVVVLLVWHIMRRDPWRIHPRLYVWMWVESLVLAIPLFVYALLLFRDPSSGTAAAPSAAVLAAAPNDGWQAMLIFSIGAGIYEELLFRLIGIAVLHMILVDVLVFNEKLGAIAAVALSAMAFALYHFSEDNLFTWSKCLFYSGAGVYFAAVYVLRGFGIVAGTHAVYDVIVVLLQVSHVPGET